MSASTEPPIVRRTRITVRAFICHENFEHKFRASVRSAAHIDFTERAVHADFQPFGTSDWQPLPLCPECGALAEEEAFYQSSRLAVVPSGQRFVGWLSPDGSKLAVPGVSDARMPARYVTAGYKRVEAHTMNDIDRFDAIRAAQTGNHAYNEMNYDSATREYRQNANVDFDSEAAEKSEI